ncbi:MAG: GNAT family N-acetyltransferase [bacterium]|nr:GNAT family N-acetyltransferase [bacterium]
MKAINFPKYIKCERVYLRSLRSKDAEVLFDLIDSQRDYIGEHLDWVKYVKTVDDEVKYIKRRVEEAKNCKGFDWCIFRNNTDEFVGYIGTDPVSVELFENGASIDWENGILSFAFFLKKEASGNGYMTEALGALKDIAVEIGFKRIEIGAEETNIKSQKVAERCGFDHDKEDLGAMYFENKN